MFEAKAISVDDKAEFYRELAQQLEGLLSGERDPIANTANSASLLFTTMPDLNWAGFYFLKTPDELVLGPFQGNPACMRIAAAAACAAWRSRKAGRWWWRTCTPSPAISRAMRRRARKWWYRCSGRPGIRRIDLDSPLSARFDRDDSAASKL